jgi:hypothetical protein
MDKQHFALDRNVFMSVMYMRVTESRGMVPEMVGIAGAARPR